MKFTFERPDDETLEVKLDDESLVTLTHDQDGWGAMETVEKLVTQIANKLNIPVEEA